MGKKSCIPSTFSLHPCGLYARKRLKHWNQNNTGAMHLDATLLKEIIEEWINGPYVDKEYICNYDIDELIYGFHQYYCGVYEIARENGKQLDTYKWKTYGEDKKCAKTKLLDYLKNLPKTKVNFNGVKGFTLYDATNLEEIILNWLEKNDCFEKN